MNIDTIKAIEYVIKNRYSNDFMEVKIDSSESKGKWFHKMRIGFDKDRIYFIPHVEQISLVIGHFYGEGLWTKKRGRFLYLS